MTTHGAQATDDDLDDEPSVDVERMPNVGEWELYKAIDEKEERERWTLGFRREIGAGKGSRSVVDYALWLDPAKDPDESGRLEGTEYATESWATNDELDDEARESLLLTLLERADRSFPDYGYRIVIELSAPVDDSSDGEPDGEVGEDDEDFDP